MNDNNFEAVVTAIGEKLNSQALTISTQKWELENLQAKLDKAENELKRLGKKGEDNERL